MRPDFVSRQQLELLPGRIHKAEETEATHEVYSFLWDLFRAKDFKPLKIMVVGAGRSFPAAISVSHSLRDELRTTNVETYTPQTALRVLTQRDFIMFDEFKPFYDVVIGISYSGKTPDIKAVYKDCTERGFPFVLFTGADKETLREEYNDFKDKNLKVISYFNPEDTTGKELGMISMFSTLAPAILFDDYLVSSDPKARYYDVYENDLKKGEEFVSKLNISRIARVLKSRPIIHVIYEWRTYALAEDIACKFMESGIANVVLHEKKNFSHGGYTLLYKQKFGMVINLTKFDVGINVVDCTSSLYHNDYDTVLDEFLKGICKKKSAIYIEMGSGQIFPAQVLTQELSKLPYLITAIGEEMGTDISNPYYPDSFLEETKALYDYQGEF